MQAIIAIFFTLLGNVIVPLAWRLLRGLGFVAVTYTGVSLLLDKAKDYVFANFASIPVEWVNLAGLLKLDVCFNIYFSALLIRATLWGMDKSKDSKTTINMGG